VSVTLTRFTCREYNSCGKKQEASVHISGERPTLLACLQELRKRLEEHRLEERGNCAQALTEKDAADASAATVSPDTPNVLQAMMQLRQVKSRAEAANELALEAEKKRDAAEKAVEEMKRQLQPKRARTDDDAGDAHEMLAEVHNWDLRDHRQQATRVQNRRNVQDEFPATSSSGIRNRDVRVAEIVAREPEKAKPDKWGCVQAHDLWSPQEESQVRPGHFWLLKFLEATAAWRRSSNWAPVSTRSTRGCALATVTAPSWLTCGCSEWMKMPQV
jgi:hypothetical protein